MEILGLAIICSSRIGIAECYHEILEFGIEFINFSHVYRVLRF